MVNTFFSLPNNYQATWLIGFRFNPDNPEPKLFTLMFSGNEDIPLSDDGYIIFFENITSVSEALELIPSNQRGSLTIPKEIELVVDIALILYLTCYEETDDNATIINGLNIIFDLVKSTGIDFPKGYKQSLYKFADHLTFSREVVLKG